MRGIVELGNAQLAGSGVAGLSAHLFGQLGPDAVALGEDILRPQIEILADLIAPR
ncbi:hypothetical protein PQI65_07110 [Brachybacterium paraconglomeratum]